MQQRIDFEALSLEELKTIQRQAAEAAVKVREKQRRLAIEEIEQVAEKYGFTLDELIAPPPPVDKPRKRIAPKYRHPDKPELTWTGRGKKPGWVSDHEKTGGVLDDLLIDGTA